MKKRNWILLFPLILASCGKNVVSKDDKISVMIEQGENFKAYSSSLRISRGENASFRLGMLNHSKVLGVSYPNYQVKYVGEVAVLTLNHVYYPTVVQITTTYEAIPVDFCGGRIPGSDLDEYRYPIYQEHERVNLPNLNLVKDGYQLYGYKTDLNSEDSIPLGSRFARDVKNLYADFKKEVSRDSLIVSSLDEKTCELVSYSGDDKEVILPSFVDGKKLVSIRNGCFSNKNMDILFISNTVNQVQKGAFSDCGITTLCLFDSLREISDASFENTDIGKVRINTYKKPSYMNSFFALFPDKVDLLIKNKGKKKLVLFSGSTTRYGYDCSLLKEAYPDYEPVNMGVFAYVNQRPQLEIIRHFLEDGDVLLVSPEFDVNALDLQFFMERQLDNRIFRMMESDYQLFSYIDIHQYQGVFDAFSKYVKEKDRLYHQEYALSPQYFDDDGAEYTNKIYDEYLDFSLLRYGEVLSGRMFQPEIDYTTERFYEGFLDTYNTFYDDFTTKDVSVYFTYAPRNIDSLTEASVPEKRRELEALLNEKIHLPIISKMEDSFYPAYDFYKIDDHLTTEGAIFRTKKVIEDLKPYLMKH